MVATLARYLPIDCGITKKNWMNKQKNLRHLIMLKFLTMSTKSGIFPTFGLFFIYFYLSLTFSFVAPPRPRYFDHFFVILALNLIHFPISKETCLNRSDHNYSSSGIKVRSCVQKWQEDAQTALFFIFFSYSAKEILKLKWRRNKNGRSLHVSFFNVVSNFESTLCRVILNYAIMKQPANHPLETCSIS